MTRDVLRQLRDLNYFMHGKLVRVFNVEEFETPESGSDETSYSIQCMKEMVVR